MFMLRVCLVWREKTKNPCVSFSPLLPPGYIHPPQERQKGKSVRYKAHALVSPQLQTNMPHTKTSREEH